MNFSTGVRVRHLMGVAAAVGALAGCSGATSEDAAPAPGPTATVLEPPGAAADTASYGSPEELAKAFGCRDVERSKEKDEVVAAESQAGCTLDGETVYLVMFADDADRDRFVQMSDVMARPRLIGTGWVIHASPKTLQDLQDSLGGELRTATAP